MNGLKRVLSRLTASHGYRSWQRYGDARGNILAGGVAYLGFFSIIPALVLGFAVFGFVLRDQRDLFDQVVSSVSDTLPGIVKDSGHPDGLIDATAPPTPNALTIAGLISLVTLLLSGLGWVDALREGVRAVFGLPKLQANPVKGKLRDLFVLVTLGLALVASAALALVVASAGAWLLEQVGVDQSSTPGRAVLQVVAVLVVLVADTGLMVVVLRLMSGISLPRSDLLHAALFGAIGLGVLKLASGLLLRSAANKPVLAGFAVVIGLLVVLNLMSRIMLLSAAWAATTAHEHGRLAVGAAAPQHDAPLGPRELVLPSFGQRSADRTAVAAGAVLGVIAAVGVRGLRHGLRAAVTAVRGR